MHYGGHEVLYFYNLIAGIYAFINCFFYLKVPVKNTRDLFSQYSVDN